MKVIVCELCDSRDVVKQDGVFVCKSCGAKYSTEEARNLMKEVEGEAPVASEASSSDAEKYLLLARRAKESGNDADAAKYYGMVQAENPNDWESAYYSVYCTAAQTNIANIASAANLITGNLSTVVMLIKEHTPSVKQPVAVKELVDSGTAMAFMLYKAAKKHYDGIDSSIRAQHIGEFRQRALAALLLCYSIGTSLDLAFGKDSICETMIKKAFVATFEMYTNDSEAFKEKMNIDMLKQITKYAPTTTESYIQKWLTEVNGRIKLLSSKTASHGCLGFLALFLGAAGFFITDQFFAYYDEEPYAFLCLALGVLACILLFIPFPKSKARKEREGKIIAKLEAERKNLEALS